MRARRRPAVADSDRRLVDRTALRLGATAAALTGGVVVLVSVVLGLLVLQQTDRADRAQLAHTAATATSAAGPPSGTFLTVVTGGRQESTAALPAGLPDLPALVAAEAAGRTTEQALHLRGRHLLLLTRPRDGGAVQAAFDLSGEDALRRHVVEAALGTGLAGLLAAAAVATLLARRAVAPLARALSLQRTFVADASHELRTPLTLLTTRAQLLRRQLDRGEPGAARADADDLVEDAGRLAEVVEDLLLAADPRADAARAPVELAGLCAQVVSSAAPHAAELGVRLTLTAPAPQSATVNAAAVRRALLALVDNALRHAGPGGVVDLAVLRERRAVALAVTDSGPGIDPARAPELFARFASGEQSAPHRGYGLGLALVRDIAVRHGGSLRLDPSPVGARFVLRLPR